MTKNTLLIGLLLTFSLMVQAQSDEIINGGFENWPTTNLLETPDQWLTNNTDLPDLVTKSADAIDQNFSARIETKVSEDGTSIPGALILGVSTGGSRIGGIPYTAAVDTMVFWAKYDIQPNDSASFIVVQSQDTLNIASWRYVGGQQDNWTRIALPLLAPAQDSITIAFSSGDLFSEMGMEGSWLMVDRVELVKAGSTPPALPNASLENWDEITFSDPEGWSTINPLLSLFGLPPNVTPSSDSRSGSSAALLEVQGLFGDTLPAVITYGGLDQEGDAPGVAYTGTPSSFDGWYKYEPFGTDTAIVAITFLKEQAVIAFQFLLITDPANLYTEFNLPLTFIQFPDTVQIFITAGNNPGSRLLIDDFRFGGLVSTEEAAVFKGLQLAPNPAKEMIRVSHPEASMPFEMRLFTTQGKLLDHKISDYHSDGVVEFPLHAYPSGIYFMEILNGKERAIRKVVKK